MRYLFLIPLALIMFSMTAFATQYNISPSDDVYVNEHNPTSNYNSQTSLKGKRKNENDRNPGQRVLAQHRPCAPGHGISACSA